LEISVDAPLCRLMLPEYPMNLTTLDVHAIQAQAIYYELSHIARLGFERVDLADTPILKLIYFDNPARGYRELIDVVSRSIDRMPDKRHQAATRMLFGIGSEHRKARTAEDRASAAAETMGVQVEAFRKTWRERILKSLGCQLSSERIWIGDSERSADAGFDATTWANIVSGAPRLDRFLADNPGKLRTNYHYSVEIDVDAGNSVETSYSSTRLLPDTETFAVYICRSYESISKAIVDRSIVGLEVADISLPQWRDVCADFTASLAASGRQDAAVEPVAVAINDDQVRFDFAAASLTSFSHSPSSLTVLTSYRLSADARRFPVKFANHFTIGGLKVDLRLRSQRALHLSHAEYLAGLHDGAPIPKGLVYERATTHAARFKQSSVSLAPQMLVWPGSGIEFFWTLEDSTR